MTEPLRLYRWADAPAALQALSDHGGGEVLVAVVPEAWLTSGPRRTAARAVDAARSGPSALAAGAGPVGSRAACAAGRRQHVRHCRAGLTPLRPRALLPPPPAPRAWPPHTRRSIPGLRARGTARTGPSSPAPVQGQGGGGRHRSVFLLRRTPLCAPRHNEQRPRPCVS